VPCRSGSRRSRLALATIGDRTAHALPSLCGVNRTPAGFGNAIPGTTRQVFQTCHPSLRSQLAANPLRLCFASPTRSRRCDPEAGVPGIADGTTEASVDQLRHIYWVREQNGRKVPALSQADRFAPPTCNRRRGNAPEVAAAYIFSTICSRMRDHAHYNTV
jgi:hypothetical protein